MILQGVSFTCRPGSILIDDLHDTAIIFFFLKGTLSFFINWSHNHFAVTISQQEFLFLSARKSEHGKYASN